MPFDPGVPATPVGPVVPVVPVVPVCPVPPVYPVEPMSVAISLMVTMTEGVAGLVGVDRVAIAKSCAYGLSELNANCRSSPALNDRINGTNGKEMSPLLATLTSLFDLGTGFPLSMSQNEMVAFVL